MHRKVEAAEARQTTVGVGGCDRIAPRRFDLQSKQASVSRHGSHLVLGRRNAATEGLARLRLDAIPLSKLEAVWLAWERHLLQSICREWAGSRSVQRGQGMRGTKHGSLCQTSVSHGKAESVEFPGYRPSRVLSLSRINSLGDAVSTCVPRS